MNSTRDHKTLLKKINSQNGNHFNLNKIKGKTLTPQRSPQKNVPFKDLNFDPSSFISYKYSPKTLILMNRKRKNFEENSGRNNNNNTIIINKNNIEYIYSFNTKKLTLKPVNKNRSCSQFQSQNEDILIPSNKTTQEIINYNKSNARNTLLNYYHKNNRNLKIINFIKNNSCKSNYFPNSLNKSSSLNKILINNSSYISKNDLSTNLKKNDNLNQESNINKSLLKPYLYTRSIKLQKKNKVNNKINIDYESDIVTKKIPHNLSLYAENLIKEINKKENITSDKNNIEIAKDHLSIKKHDNAKDQIIKYKDKGNLFASNLTNTRRRHANLKNINHKMKNYNSMEKNKLEKRINQLLLSPNTNKVRNKNNLLGNNELNKENKILSYKEIKALSKKGFEKMKLDSYKRFNLLIKNTNKEVIHLGKKLDELLEENTKILYDVKSNLDV